MSQLPLTSVLLYGKGRTNAALYECLKQIGNYEIFLGSDQKEDWEGYSGFLSREEICHRQFDRVFVPPGIACTHWIHKHFRAENELSFALDFYRGKTIAVTGTNGKSTLVSMLGQWFCDQGKKTIVAGNIGLPLSSRWTELEDCEWLILELSSFQLFSMKDHLFDAVCLTSYEPDHLDWHPDERHYQEAKARIFQMLKSGGVLVCSAEFPLMPQDVLQLDGKTPDISWNDDGVFLCRKKISGDAPRKDLSRSWAISAVILSGLGFENPSFPEFSGLSHRLEMIQTEPFIAVNDSKATTFGSTIYALGSLPFKNISLILGGKSKKGDFSGFIRDLIVFQGRIRRIFLYGDGGELESGLVKAGFSVVYHRKWAEILEEIAGERHECILLSPGYSSLDQFSSFEQRGFSFREFIQKLPR